MTRAAATPCCSFGVLYCNDDHQPEAQAAPPDALREALVEALRALVTETDASGDSDSEAYEQARDLLRSLGDPEPKEDR